MVDTDETNRFFEVPFTVIGVVKDYFFESLHAPLRGQVIVNRDQDINRLLVKLRADTIPATLTEIERAWKRIDQVGAFSYAFLSESFDRLYCAEQRLGSWTRSFAYRAGFNPLLFLSAGAAALLLAVLTISLRTAKASTSNPVKALRYE